MSLASNFSIKETKRMSADISDLMSYKDSVQKEEGRQDIGIGMLQDTPATLVTCTTAYSAPVLVPCLLIQHLYTLLLY